jgi:hypothetical protein
MPPPIISSRRKARDRFLVRLSLSSVVGFDNRKLFTQSRLLYLPKWKDAREVCDKNPMISIYCTIPTFGAWGARQFISSWRVSMPPPCTSLARASSPFIAFDSWQPSPPPMSPAAYKSKVGCGIRHKVMNEVLDIFSPHRRRQHSFVLNTIVHEVNERDWLCTKTSQWNLRFIIRSLRSWAASAAIIIGDIIPII